MKRFTVNSEIYEAFYKCWLHYFYHSERHDRDLCGPSGLPKNVDEFATCRANARECMPIAMSVLITKHGRAEDWYASQQDARNEAREMLDNNQPPPPNPDENMPCPLSETKNTSSTSETTVPA